MRARCTTASSRSATAESGASASCSGPRRGRRAQEAQRAWRERAGAGGRGAVAAHEGARRRRQPGAVGQRSVAALAGGHRRVDALQAQQPELEIAHQGVDRDVGGQRFDDRRAEAEQLLVGVVLRRPLVDQLGEVADVAEGFGMEGGERRPLGVGVVQRHQLAALLLEVDDRGAGQWFEGAPKPGAKPPRPFGHAALLAAVAGQEHHDAVRVVQLVGAENQARRWCATAWSQRWTAGRHRARPPR